MRLRAGSGLGCGWGCVEGYIVPTFPIPRTALFVTAIIHVGYHAAHISGYNFSLEKKEGLGGA